MLDVAGHRRYYAGWLQEKSHCDDPCIVCDWFFVVDAGVSYTEVFLREVKGCEAWSFGEVTEEEYRRRSGYGVYG